MTIETDGHPLLQLTPFAGLPKPPYRFDCEDVAITISNVAIDEREDRYDFLLSYRALVLELELPVSATL